MSVYATPLCQARHVRAALSRSAAAASAVSSWRPWSRKDQGNGSWGRRVQQRPGDDVGMQMRHSVAPTFIKLVRSEVY
jgi:hypothetical protein